MAEANNLLGGFDPNLGMVQVGKQIKSLYNPDHRNFAPRLGLAWDLSGKGTTVIRAGGGIIFNTLLPMQTFTGVAGNAVNVSGGVATVPTGASNCREWRVHAGHGHDRRRECHNSRRLWLDPGIELAEQQFQRAHFLRSQHRRVQRRSSDGGSPPCSLAVIDHNFRTPYVTTWTLGRPACPHE